MAYIGGLWYYWNYARLGLLFGVWRLLFYWSLSRGRFGILAGIRQIQRSLTNALHTAQGRLNGHEPSSGHHHHVVNLAAHCYWVAVDYRRCYYR